MKANTKKRVLAGCLAVLMLLSNASEVLASNLSEPLIEVTETVENTETVTDTEMVEGTESTVVTEEVETTEENLPSDSETTEVVEESENTETLEELETEQMEIAVETEPEKVISLTSDGTVSDLTFTFTDWSENEKNVSTANTTENTIKLIIFDVNQTSSFTPAEALRNQSGLWEKLSSSKVEFVWLIYNGTTKNEFSSTCPNHYSAFNEISEKYPEMVNRFSVCLNGGNTTEGGTIEDAFYAYWDELDWTNHEANVKGDVKDYGMGGHFPVVFMVNGSNEIVGIYQYNDMLDNSFWTDIAEDLTQYLGCNLPAPTDLTVVEDDFEEILIEWNYESMDGVAGFKVYRSDDNGNTYSAYEDDWYTNWDDNGNANCYYMYVDAPLDPETGNNGIYTYKVVPVDDVGLEGEGATIKNKGGCVGTDIKDTKIDGTVVDYTGICFVDADGNAIDGLELHVGESKKIGLAFTKADGSLVNMSTDAMLKGKHTWPDYYDEVYGGYSYDINWEIKSTTSDETELSLDRVDYETSDVDWLFTEEVIEAKEAYFKAKSMPAEDTKYFIEVRVTGPLDASEIFWLRLPVSVVTAEEGVSYTQPAELTVYTDEAAAEQEMRNLMTKRDYDSWIVTNGVDEFDYEVVMDIYAERAGMNPNEGDYLYYTMGDRNSTSTLITYFNRGYITYKNKSYDINAITVPFITTAEEEQQVDNEINALIHTPGGALYEYAHGENVTDEEKIQAIYNWITKNVSGIVPGDRTTPIYHTAYHCLIEGSGTCGAFAVLFTRMTREMGIASKVIMGTDAAAHAYNIVQLGNKWYFIDTSTGRYLADATNFERAQEQPHYLDEDKPFIKNYLSKIPGNTYVLKNDGIAVVTSSDGLIEKTFGADEGYLEGAYNYIEEQAKLTGSDITYTLTITEGNMAMPETGLLFEYANRVTIDLGGYSLCLRDGLTATIAAKKVYNGQIEVGDWADICLYAPYGQGEIRYENVDIIYKSTESGADNAPMLRIMASRGSKLVLTDTVTVEKFDTITLVPSTLYDGELGEVEVNADLTADYVYMGDGQTGISAKAVCNGTITANKELGIWGGTVEADSIVSKTKTTFDNPSITAFVISDVFDLAGVTQLSGDYTGTASIALVRQFATADDTTPNKQATITLAGTIANSSSESGELPLFHIIAKDYVGEEVQENKAFSSGTTIGTVSAKGAGNVTLTSTNLKDYITVEVAAEGNAFADIEGGNLSVVSKSVTVTEASTGKSQSFSSLKKAIDGLANVASKTAGKYTFTFAENTVLSANVTLPDYVKDVIFVAADDEIEIDFKGYTLSTKGDIAISAGVKLVNSAETNGKLISTKSCDITDYAIRLLESVEGISISATNGTLMLVGAENKTKTITADVTAKVIIVYDTWKVEGAITNSTVQNAGTLICNTLTQKSSNQANLEANSILIVEKQADLYNVTCVESIVDGQPSIYRAKNATVSINGTFKSESRNLIFGVLTEDDAEIDGPYDTFVDFVARETLFATAIKNFPIEKVELLQNAKTPKYTTLLQVDGKLVVVGEWIILKSQGVDGTEEIIKKFTNWKEASAYINTLSNASMTYVVEITDHLDLEEALTMPTKAAGIIFRGVSEEEELVELNYTGDLKLSMNTTFENIKLGAEKYNSKTKEYEPYLSAANLSGKTLTFLNSDAEFASITGTNTSNLIVIGNGNTVTVQKAVKTLNEIEVSGATLEIGSALKLTEVAISGVKDITLTDAEVVVESGTVAMTGTLYMDNATLDTNSKVEVVDIISNSTDNRILYGGNATNNILTVKGIVTAGPDIGEDTNLPFRKAAIDITVKSLADDGYVQNTVLLNATKASATWFVIGSEYEGVNRVNAEYVTHKVGTVIKCGEAADANVTLYVIDEENGYIPCESYATLQEAFDEITRIADATASYGIVLNSDAGDAKKTITTPQKAASVVISGANSVKTLYFSNGFTLKSDVTLENIALSPASNGTFTLGDFTLELRECELAEGKKITSISGSGTAKASELILKDTDLYVAGTVKAIGTLTLADATLTAESDIAVGNIVNPVDTTGVLVGTATVTRSKDVITKVTPKITIEGTVDIAGKGISVTLRELVNKIYDEIDFSESTVTETIRKNGISFVKAVNVSTDSLTFYSKYLTQEDECVVVKSAGYLMTIIGEDYGATVTYTNGAGQTVTTKFVNFADAVTEINNLKTKRDYTITLYDGISKQPAKALTMPNKSYVDILTIEGAGESDYVTLYHTGNITLSTPTVLKDVLFAKSGLTNDYPAAITLSTSGNALTIDGYVYFNTPVTFNGGNKGTLDVTSEGQICTLTNGVSAPESKLEQYIHGSITGFAEVNVSAGQIFTISEFGVLSGTKTNYTAATFNVTTLNNEGEVNVIGNNKPGTVKITNANLNNGHIYSSGTINVTNMNLEGEVKVQAEKDFNITGKLISATDKAAFYSRQKAANNPVPYLNISATVTLENPTTDKIKVGVYDVTDADKLVTLHTAPKATAQLLTASKATADMFVADEGNVGNVGQYSATNTNGYFLMKSGSAIYTYYYQDVAVALCKGNADTGVLADADVIAYYPSFKDAVSAIEAYKDKTAEYTLILLKDVNTEDAPAAVTLPGTAAKVIITSESSASGDMCDLYYTGNLSLKTNTEFVRVCLNPMKSKNVGTASSIAAGNFDLTLRDITLGNLSDMAIKDITGSTKQTTTLAVEGLTIAGSINNSKELVIEKPMAINGNVKVTAVTIANGTSSGTNDLTVNGTFATDKVEMRGYASIHAGNTLTIKDIVNEQTTGLGDAQTNTIYYGVNSKGVGNLTVKGIVSSSGESNMIFNLVVDSKTKDGYQLGMDDNAVKAVLTDSKKIAVVEKAATSEMDFQINGTALEKAEVVKANKGVYVINTSSYIGENRAVLEYEQDGKQVNSVCLDMAQAATEINTLANKTAIYTIKVGMDGTDVRDANLTDANTRSALTMPNANAVADLTIKSATNNAINISGNISFAGNLTISRCGINIQNISSVKKLTLDSVNLTTTGIVSVTDIVISGTTKWNALGAVTVTKLDASQMGTGAYLSTKQKASGTTFVPQFTIKETVTLDAENTPIPWKVFTTQAAQGNLTEVSAYKNVSLVIAAKANADKFVAYPFAEANIETNTEGMTKENLIAYKNTKNEVISGDKDDMVVHIVQTHETDGVTEVTGETYAGSFDEAVTIINNLADTKASYRMELLQGGIDKPIMTTKNGTAYGALTLPTKAASITLVGAVEDNPAVIFYTGTLKPSCDLTLENVALTEGTIKTVSGVQEFVPSYGITPSLSNAYTLTFGENATTVYKEGNRYADIYLTSMTAAKGSLVIEDASVYVEKTLNVKDLQLGGESVIRTKDKATITELIITGSTETDAEPVKFYAEKITAITNITGTGTLYLENYFTTISNANQQCTTQLEIKGNISGVEVELVPVLYNLDEKYHKMDAVELAAFNITTAKPTNAQKLVTMPKASPDNISVWYSNGTSELQQVTTSSLYKQDGILYLTNMPRTVRVIGKNTTGAAIYEADFLSWDQAVKEIDKISDSTISYQMILLESIDAGTITSFTLPAKASEVYITSEADETNYVCFTGTSVSLKCNTTFEKIGLFAVKKSGTTYVTTSYNVSAGNYVLKMAEMMYQKDALYNTIGNLTGATKGSLQVDLGTEENNTWLAVNKISGFGTIDVYNEVHDEVINENLTQSVYAISTGISGVGTLNVHPGVIIKSEKGDISVKDLNATGATVEAKNITVSQNSTLESAKLIAGSTATNDGKLKLNTITVEDACNYLSAEQDKNGKTQMEITGTVTPSETYPEEAGESAIVVDLYYNNYNSHVKLYDGIALLNATKAASSWFEPYYTTLDEDDEVVDGMGHYTYGFGTYKSGKEIRYGNLDGMEVELTMMQTIDNESNPMAYSYFATFEEAVKEIDSLALYKTGTKVFEDYQITLLSEFVEIGNEKKNNQYSALNLPSKAGTVTIDGALFEDTEIGFSGNLTLKSNVVFKDVALTPVKVVSNKLTTTTTNISIGNYTLTFDNVDMTSDDGASFIGNITGSSKSGTFKVLGTSEDTCTVKATGMTGLYEVNLVENVLLDVSGNVSVYQVRFTASDKDAKAQLNAGGTFTTTLIYKDGTGEAVLGKGVGKKMTINGAELDLDGDKKKEKYTVFYSHPAEENAGKIKIQISGTDKVLGAEVLTCKYLNIKDYSCINTANETYGTYQSGTSLMLGKKAV